MKRRDARAEILAVLADMEWHTANDVKERTGLSQSAVIDNLNRLSGQQPWSRQPHEGPLVDKEERIRTDEFRVERSGLEVLPPRMWPADGPPKEKRRPQWLVHYRLRKTGE